MQFKLTINQLQSFLAKNTVPTQLQADTNQLYVLHQRSGIEMATFLRILDKGELLQILTFLPFKLISETKNDVARLLHKINHDLDMPGFGMNETSQLIYYRTMLPCLHSSCDGDVLLNHIKALPRIIPPFANIISEVASGAKRFDDFLVKPPEITQ